MAEEGGVDLDASLCDSDKTDLNSLLKRLGDNLLESDRQYLNDNFMDFPADPLPTGYRLLHTLLVAEESMTLPQLKNVFNDNGRTNLVTAIDNYQKKRARDASPDRPLARSAKKRRVPVVRQDFLPSSDVGPQRWSRCQQFLTSLPETLRLVFSSSSGTGKTSLASHLLLEHKKTKRNARIPIDSPIQVEGILQAFDAQTDKATPENLALVMSNYDAIVFSLHSKFFASETDEQVFAKALEGLSTHIIITCYPHIYPSFALNLTWRQFPSDLINFTGEDLTELRNKTSIPEEKFREFWEISNGSIQVLSSLLSLDSTSIFSDHYSSWLGVFKENPLSKVENSKLIAMKEHFPIFESFFNVYSRLWATLDEKAQEFLLCLASLPPRTHVNTEALKEFGMKIERVSCLLGKETVLHEREEKTVHFLHPSVHVFLLSRKTDEKEDVTRLCDVVGNNLLQSLESHEWATEENRQFQDDSDCLIFSHLAEPNDILPSMENWKVALRLVQLLNEQNSESPLLRNILFLVDRFIGSSKVVWVKDFHLSLLKEWSKAKLFRESMPGQLQLRRLRSLHGDANFQPTIIAIRGSLAKKKGLKLNHPNELKTIEAVLLEQKGISLMRDPAKRAEARKFLGAAQTKFLEIENWKGSTYILQLLSTITDDLKEARQLVRDAITISEANDIATSLTLANNYKHLASLHEKEKDKIFDCEQAIEYYTTAREKYKETNEELYQPDIEELTAKISSLSLEKDKLLLVTVNVKT